MANDAAQKEMNLAALEQQLREVELEVNEKDTHVERVKADVK